MKTCFEAITRLLAPILAFTAEEAWGYAGHTESVHLEMFPEPKKEYQDAKIEACMEEWLKLRGLVYQQAIEPARQAKTISKPLEASITLEAPADVITRLQDFKTELEEFFIISELHFVTGDETVARLEKSPHSGCARCWRYLPDVGKNPSHSDICERCAEAVEVRVSAG